MTVTPRVDHRQAAAGVCTAIPLCILIATALPACSQKIPVDSADQLPVHTYAVTSPATKLVEDDALFAEFASKLEADLRSDLATYDIADHETVAEYYSTLASLALIEGRYQEAVDWAAKIRTVEDKPGPRAVAGTLERAIATAAKAPADQRVKVFEDTYRKEIAAVPYEQARPALQDLKGFTEIRSPNSALGFLASAVEPAARSGQISRELAIAVVMVRSYFKVIQPYQDAMIEVLAETIAAHRTNKPDIWAARSVSLDGRSDLTPVRIGIWDSGVDASLFSDRVFVNPGEIPGNGIDDDGNGFVDDVHGIAHDLQIQRTTGDLLRLPFGQEEAARARDDLKGFIDLQAGLETPEADRMRRLMRALKPDEFGPFTQSFRAFMDYVHGTHVAGISVDGNPAARIVIGRETGDYRTIPDTPTVKQSEDWANEFRDKVHYFKEHGVRVVNMSWIVDGKGIDNALEVNNAGGTAEERGALAQRLFAIQKDALRQVIADAPTILFVAAAGNENHDNRFADSIPSSLDLPNLITVGAVDQAGEEAAFTSYGKVEIWANGYEVRSVIPGGEVMALSGTSMAAPQVTNLAAKLLAVSPNLSVADLRRLILEGSDEKVTGENHRVRLLNPQRSMQLLGRQGPRLVRGVPTPR